MAHYVGIDLGTTNSVICSFDGENIRLFKSPDQNDVTPSALFFDKRGNKYVGKRAYDQAAHNPGSAATLFKRLMGTSTPIKLPSANLILSPEECSAEILTHLYGYLQEEIRNDPTTGTVITVPAAFNQMQKDATMAAAEMASLGNVALMQEPVAAVMSVMRQRKEDSIFLVFDIGGGTLDIAIAQSINGRVSLLSHGGIAMCGGRDFDRLLFDNVVSPWLLGKFDLPSNYVTDQRFAILKVLGIWAIEKAKIELSANEESVISLDDTELRIKDNSGTDIYLDISISRSVLNDLMASQIEDAIGSARETMEKATLNPHDIGRVVFVGGPAQYQPLREKVSFELGICASSEVNPMTAVAEGAALFAESIDWTSQNRGRKSGRGTIAGGNALDVSFNYQARTPGSSAKIGAILSSRAVGGSTFQIDSLDTGWSSGKVALVNGASIEVPLPKPGENSFKVFVFDSAGGAIKLAQDKITISRTAAQIDAIPASHSVAVEVLNNFGGSSSLFYLVCEGEQLPKKGKVIFKAEESLRAGDVGSIKIKLWEGDIEDRIEDNNFIGLFEIKGSYFTDGVIAKGAELICEYQVLDSGNIFLDVTIPSIQGSFNSGRNFYSRQGGELDYSKVSKLLAKEHGRVGESLRELASKISDPKLDLARDRLERAVSATNGNTDPEVAKQAKDDIQEAKKLLAKTRKENLKIIRKLEIERAVDFFNKNVSQFARQAEVDAVEKHAEDARRAIERESRDFESCLDMIRSKTFMILWRQDWYVIDRFKWLSEDIFLFPDAIEHENICKVGHKALHDSDIDKLREVVSHLDSMRVVAASEDEMIARSNILVG